jgi:hypothetical protein
MNRIKILAKVMFFSWSVFSFFCPAHAEENEMIEPVCQEADPCKISLERQVDALKKVCDQLLAQMHPGLQEKEYKEILENNKTLIRYIKYHSDELQDRLYAVIKLHPALKDYVDNLTKTPMPTDYEPALGVDTERWE